MLTFKHIGPSFQGRGATLVVPPWFNQQTDSIQAVRRLRSIAVTGEPVPIYLHSLLPMGEGPGMRVFRPARSRVSFRESGGGAFT